MTRHILSGDAVAALFAPLAALEHEVAGFAYLGTDGALLAVRYCLAQATAGSVTAPLRAVAADAVRLRATRVVMAHNHPSGDPSPSRADRAFTRRLALALDALGAPLVEHLVLSRVGHHSFAAAGFV